MQCWKMNFDDVGLNLFFLWLVGFLHLFPFPQFSFSFLFVIFLVFGFYLCLFSYHHFVLFILSSVKVLIKTPKEALVGYSSLYITLD